MTPVVMGLESIASSSSWLFSLKRELVSIIHDVLANRAFMDTGFNKKNMRI